jgi:antitoxin MazE
VKTNVHKWGNSLAVRIPKSFAEEMGIGTNAPVEMSLEEGALLIKPDKEKDWHFETLLAGVTNENTHPAWETESFAADSEEETAEDVE